MYKNYGEDLGEKALILLAFQRNLLKPRKDEKGSRKDWLAQAVLKAEQSRADNSIKYKARLDGITGAKRLLNAPILSSGGFGGNSANKSKCAHSRGVVAHLCKDLVAAALGNSIKSVAGGNSSGAQQMELPHFVRRTSDSFPPYSLYILAAKLKTRKSGVIPALFIGNQANRIMDIK